MNLGWNVLQHPALLHPSITCSGRCDTPYPILTSNQWMRSENDFIAKTQHFFRDEIYQLPERWLKNSNKKYFDLKICFIFF